MKGLLIKDFKLMKQQKNFFFLIAAIAVLNVIFGENSSFGVFFLTFTGSLLTISTINFDEYDNGNAFLFSLPISRKTYVKEKYMFGLFGGIGLLLFSSIICWMVSWLRKDGSYSMMISVYTVIMLMVMLTLILPFHLKYGGEKGRVAMIIMFAIIAAVVSIGLKLMEMMRWNVSGHAHHMLSISMNMNWILWLILAFVGYWISYRISIGIMEKKEF